ncbi:MAG: LamG domain-containing protein, partial [Candidatus Eisenbacteria sp.]|nr:LamG domain-containing protein [Candidatus Eisenbacteria bacterium]
MYLSFDNGEGQDFPDSVQDEISGLTFTKVTEGSGSVTYDANTNPWFNTDGTSARFVNESGLESPSMGDHILDLAIPAYTVETFIKINSFVQDQTVILKKYSSDYITWEYYTSGIMRYATAGESDWVTATTALELDRWYHVAIVFDSTNATEPQKIFIDGVQDAQGGKTTINPAANDDVVGIAHMIRPAGTRDDWMDGWLDEFRISDVALEPSQFLLYGWDIGGATRPNPRSGAQNVCPEGVVLSWKTWEDAGDVNGHDVYFGTDYASVENAQVGDDPNNVYKGRQDSNTYPEVGSLNLELDTTYFWRIDEVNENDPNIWPGYVWEFTTEDGKAYGPRPDNGWKGLPPDANLSWTGSCLASSHDVYIGTNFAEVNDANSTNHPNVDYNNVSVTSYDPCTLETFTWYYWRVDEVGDTTIKGDVWSFKTGFGGVLLYYKFDGSEGSNLPDPITDDSGNNIQFTQHIDAGSLKYAGSNPVYNSDETSAEFLPKAGLYRLDTGEDDLLRLDGYQYTIEMWLYINERDYGEEDIILVGHDDDEVSWSFEISDLGKDDDLRWYHNDTDIDEGVLTERYNEWMHVAAVFDITDPRTSQRLYFNGEVVETGNSRGLNPVDANAVGIGCETATGVTFDNFLDGRIDELRILDIALAPDEFLYPRATNPSPSNGEGGIDPNDPNEPDDPNVTLSWTPWAYATDHDVYFGTNYVNVRDGNDPNVYIGRLDTNSYDVNELNYATTYYWRIDEVEGSDVYPGAVWQFLTQFQIIDPNLLLWYPCDETSGNWVHDNSGHGLDGYDGSIGDGWNPDGYFDGCLEFDDNMGFNLDTRVLSDISAGISISVWLDGYRDNHRNCILQAGGGDYYLDVIVPDGDDDFVYWRAGNDTNDLLMWDTATPKEWRGDWHHFVFIKDEDAETMSIYFDAALKKTKPGTHSTLSNIVGKPFKVGALLSEGSTYIGKMDDLRVYDYAIPKSKVEELFRGGDLALAWAPSPYDGQPDATVTADLIWKPGNWASSHEVYFGTNKTAVEDANTTYHPGVDHNTVDVNTYEPGPLDLDTTYFWRIDEVNDVCDPNGWRGNLWRFKVANYVVIDDFE